jgi:hypothetical protein
MGEVGEARVSINRAVHNAEIDPLRYSRRRRCPSTWWAPPPSKRLGRAIPVRRVRFPSTSANGSTGVHRELWKSL